MIANLATILPYLALAGLALEATPVAAKHQGAVQRRAAHARHVKHVERNYNGAVRSSKVKREAPQISTLPDGRKCKVRPSPAAPTLSEPSSAPTQSSQAAPAPSSDGQGQEQQQQDQGQEQQQQQEDQGQGQEQQQDQASSSAAAVPEASASAAPPPAQNGWSGGCATAGWKNTGSKTGLAWPNGDYWQPDQPQYISNYIGTKSSWYYTWSAHNVKSGDENGLEFVPMIWGPGKIDEWDEAVKSNWNGAHVANALFFNEPNHHEQANISPEDSVWIWIQKFLPVRLDKQIKLGGAAPTSAPNGLEWVTRFHAACMEQGHSWEDCNSDFAPVHYYDVDVGKFQEYLENFHNTVQKPLWVTEYACQNFNNGPQCGNGDLWGMHSEMSKWMDQKDWIHRYSPFGVMQNMKDVNQNNALMSENGYITPLGSSYASGFD